MKKIVLFDMDGTLTPARKEMPSDIAERLFILHNSNYDIGIISGSGLNYIMEQCHVLFKNYGSRLDNLKIYPCNGTKYYKWNPLKLEAESQYCNSIRSELGSVKLKKVLNALLKYQIDFMNNYEFSDRFNYTGTFVDYRESIINWCPIGRNTGFNDRAVFEDLDTYFKIRNRFARVLGKDPTFSGLVIRVGGATSFDIYPHGWDKTFPMNGNSVKSGMSEYDEIYFAGDKCQQGGNDYELYEYVKNLNEENVFESTGPDHTMHFINDLISR